jgi:spermidine synthase
MNPPDRAYDHRFSLIFAAIVLCFLLSGACGLLYQVVWTRKLVLLFGTTAYAVSTVLSVFFLGLGVGSWWGGRWADRTARPLAWYGALEILIGLWAVLFLVVLHYGEGLVVALLRATAAERSAGVLLRVLLAALLLFPPTALMGATLPLLARQVNRASTVLGLRIGALYTLNTLGAVAGCYLTGFYLIQHFGYLRTTLIGAALNVIVGLLALLLARVPGAAQAHDAEPAPHEAPAVRDRPGASLALAFFVSGFCGLALEVLWTRLLAMVFLGTTYAYTTMLTAILAGIALGSAAASLLSDWTRRPALLLSLALLAAGAGTIYTLAGIATLPDSFHAADWDRSVAAAFRLSFLTLLPATFALGMTFPLVIKAAAQAGRVGAHVGRLYAINTLGGVLGALGGGFLLLPLLGTHGSILLLALTLIFAGVGLARSAASLSRPWLAATALLLLCAAGAYTQAPQDVSRALNRGYIPKDHRVLHYREGIEGTVAVSEPLDESGGSNRVLWINRVQATASIEKGVRMNRLQGVLPLLFDRDPKNVLFMCFGSGITCGTLALAGFDRIDAVEISPDVLAAAPLFAVDNLDVLHRKNVRFHLDDGRNFLLTSRDRYDFITFEPMPLALAGVSTFYTREYYALCRDRLQPDGMVSQWVPLHSLSPELVRALARTFTAVFPHACAFFINADLFLLGSNQPLLLDLAAAERRLQAPELHAVLAATSLCDPYEVLCAYLLDDAALRRFAGAGPVMGDDRPWAEFEAPKLVYSAKVPDSLAAIAPFLVHPSTAIRPESAAPAFLARLETRHQAHRNDFLTLPAYYTAMPMDLRANEGFRRSLAIDAGDCNARYYLLEDTRRHLEAMIRWEEWEKAAVLVAAVRPWLAGQPRFEALAEQVKRNQADASR